MMITLSEQLKEEIPVLVEQKLIKVIPHPYLSLNLVNYTDRQNFSGIHWTEVVRQCRGLVFNNSDEGIIVAARPFPKFFCINQMPETQEEVLNNKIKKGDCCIITEKVDGSLIICFLYHGRRMVCTRGSWESVQIPIAEKLMGNWMPLENNTYLFELIGPSNPHVVKYHKDELVFLSRINNKNGEETTEDPDVIVGRRLKINPKEHNYSLEVLKSHLDSLNGDESEGSVLFFPADGLRVKVKGKDYLRLFKLSNINSLSQFCRAALKDSKLYLEPYSSQVKDKIKEIQECCFKELPFPLDRKEFALKIKDNKYKVILFKMHNNGIIEPEEIKRYVLKLLS